MSAPRDRSFPFGHLALALAALLVVGSGLYWAFGLTFGLLSGLVVLMAPAYPLLVQAGVTALVVSLCLGGRAPRLAGVLGLACVLLPQAGLVAWYGRAQWRCHQAEDPAACFAYLDGSPLLAGFVAVAVVLALVEAVAVLAVVGAARRGAFGPGW